MCSSLVDRRQHAVDRFVPIHCAVPRNLVEVVFAQIRTGLAPLAGGHRASERGPVVDGHCVVMARSQHIEGSIKHGFQLRFAAGSGSTFHGSVSLPGSEDPAIHLLESCRIALCRDLTRNGCVQRRFGGLATRALPQFALLHLGDEFGASHGHVVRCQHACGCIERAHPLLAGRLGRACGWLGRGLGLGAGATASRLRGVLGAAVLGTTGLLGPGVRRLRALGLLGAWHRQHLLNSDSSRSRTLRVRMGWQAVSRVQPGSGLLAEDRLGQPGCQHVDDRSRHFAGGRDVPSSVEARGGALGDLVRQVQLADAAVGEFVAGAFGVLGEDQSFEAVTCDRPAYPVATCRPPFALGDLQACDDRGRVGAHHRGWLATRGIKTSFEGERDDRADVAHPDFVKVERIAFAVGERFKVKQLADLFAEGFAVGGVGVGAGLRRASLGGLGGSLGHRRGLRCGWRGCQTRVTHDGLPHARIQVAGAECEHNSMTICKHPASSRTLRNNSRIPGKYMRFVGLHVARQATCTTPPPPPLGTCCPTLARVARRPHTQGVTR
jgi:hypothetical protein